MLKANNLLKANASKVNNNECPNNFASNTATLSKKVSFYFIVISLCIFMEN